MKQTISVQTIHRNFREVEASVVGGLAVHRDAADGWHVTHVASGTFFPGMSGSRARCLALRMQLLNVRGSDWTLPLPKLLRAPWLVQARKILCHRSPDRLRRGVLKQSIDIQARMDSHRESKEK